MSEATPTMYVRKGADQPPVFYSTCPFPVICGALPQYAELLAQGLTHDIDRGVVAVPS